MTTRRQHTAAKTLVALVADAPRVVGMRCLDGLPVGGWGETQQAIRQIDGSLPWPADRDYTLSEAVDALYDSSGSHYRAWEATELAERATARARAEGEAERAAAVVEWAQVEARNRAACRAAPAAAAADARREGSAGDVEALFRATGLPDVAWTVYCAAYHTAAVG